MHRARALRCIRQLSPGFVVPRRGFGAASWHLQAVSSSASPGHTQETASSPPPPPPSPPADDQELVKSLDSQSSLNSQSSSSQPVPEAPLRAPPPIEPCEIEIENDAKLWLRRGKLILGNPAKEGKLLYLHFYHLRDQCKCPRCVDPHSKQRLFRTSDVPLNVSPRHVKWTGEQLEVQWKYDITGYDGLHKSSWSWHELVRPKTPAYSPYRLRSQVKPFAWGNEVMTRHQHWISYEDYMGDEEKFTVAMRNLARLGLIFVKDIPQSREMVEKIGTRMGALRNSFYGATWDVRTVPEAKNVAYTNQYLGFHMDLLYMNEPPGYQLLHCLENSCEGGESLFADAFRAASLLKKDYPYFYDVLTKRELCYEYIHNDQIYYNQWPVFELDPLPESGKVLRHVNYSPPFQSKLPFTRRRGETENYGDFVEMSRALRKFLRYLEHESSVFELKLNPGECVIFANRRIVHARRHFNTASGSRWLAGAYIDEDAVFSRFNVCKKNHPFLWRKQDPWVEHSKERNQRQVASEPEHREQGSNSAEREPSSAEQPGKTD